MKKLLITLTCATFLYAQGTAQTLLQPETSESLQGNLPPKQIDIFNKIKNNKTLPVIKTQRGTQNKPTGTEHRVVSAYVMTYDGAQYIKSDDSARLFFSGTHSFKDVLGQDLPDYFLSSINSENPLRDNFPQQFSRTYDVSDSTLYFGPNSSGTGFDELNRRVVNTFDANGNLTESLARNKTGGIWENSTKSVYSYSNNQIIEKIEQEWISGVWENIDKEVSTYDANDHLKEFTVLKWVAGNWTNFLNYLYQYDANGNCIVQIKRAPNGSSWDNSSKYDLTYDANNNVTELIYSLWTSGVWKEVNKETMTYNNNGDILSTLIRHKTGSSWVDASRFTYTYSANQKTNYLAESFDGTLWVKDQNNIYTYTSSGKTESEIIQNWDDAASAWKNEMRINPEYDSQDLISGVYTENWNDGGFWEKISGTLKYKFFYDTYQTTGISNTELKDVELNVYPNPASNSLNLSIHGEQPANYNLSIIDISGRLFLIQTMSKTKDIQTQLDISSLPSGTYFLKVTSSEGKLSKAFQIVR